MSGKSSSPAEWWSALEPTPEAVFHKRGDPDDPRLGEVVLRWPGGDVPLLQDQPVLIGFPCDEGVRRNGGRPGAALAPDAIREQLYRFVPGSAPSNSRAHTDILDLGNVRCDADLETCQERLGEIVATLLRSGSIPVILGGGHETAFGHYLGYVKAGLQCGIINVDAHLDVRPYPHGGHSGSPFRQAMEHITQPLGPGRYVVIGAQVQSVADSHLEYVQRYGGLVHWLGSSMIRNSSVATVTFVNESNRLGAEAVAVLVSVDADAFNQNEVPGSSAPSPLGLSGETWPRLAELAADHKHVRSIELVEVNPLFDRDCQTVRWAALGIDYFLNGVIGRERARS